MQRYLKGMKKRTLDVSARLKNAYNLLFAPHRGSLSQYNQEAPDPQQMVDLFEGEWMSAFPPPYQELKGGIYPLFQDARVDWAIEELGGVKNKTVIELGPLEGGHAYMMQKNGATSILAIEANPRAYLKCLLVKELLKLDRVEFLFGDFNAYLRGASRSFDLCVASGVLYHMQNPVELLSLIAQHCREIYLWTQYYDEKICGDGGILQSKFMTPYKKEVNGFKHTLYPFKYGASRFWSTFIGGPARTSCWLSRQDILGALSHFGFTEIQINFDEVNSLHGPCFSVVAKKHM